jgi:O-antigen ligase
MSTLRPTGSEPQSRRPFGRVARPGLVAALATVAMLTPLTVLAATSTLGASMAVAAGVLILGLVSLGLGRTAETLVVVGAALAPMNDLTLPGSASFVTAADVAFVFGFGLMMPDLLGRQLRLPASFVFGAAGVASVALVSSLLSENPALSLNSTARLLVGAFGLATLIAWWGPGIGKVAILAWAYVLGNAVSVLYGKVDGTALDDGRLFGLTEHPNIFGLCSLLAVALIPFIVSQTPPQRHWLPVLAGLVSLYGIWISGSRGALAALIALAVIYPLLARSVVAVLVLLGGFAVAAAFSESLLSESSEGNALGRLLGSGSASASDTAREQLADQAVAQFQSHPLLGVGLADVLAAHVIYLQIAAGLGLIGISFYLVVLWSTARPAMTLSPPFNLLGLPALAYITLGFVTPVLWDRYIWVVLALSLLAPQLARDRSDGLTALDRQGEAVTDEPARTDSSRR